MARIKATTLWLLREVLDMRFRGAAEIENAAPREGDDVTRASEAFHVLAERRIGIFRRVGLRPFDLGGDARLGSHSGSRLRTYVARVIRLYARLASERLLPLTVMASVPLPKCRTASRTSRLPVVE